MTDVTDTTQLNTNADDQTTLIAVSAAVGAGLVAAGLAGLAALTHQFLKRKQHGLSNQSTLCPSMQHFEYRNVTILLILHVSYSLQQWWCENAQVSVMCAIQNYNHVVSTFPLPLYATLNFTIPSSALHLMHTHTLDDGMHVYFYTVLTAI